MSLPDGIKKIISKKLFISRKGVELKLTQEELRNMYNNRLKREKQCWISSVTGINKNTLSRFRHAQIDLYPHLFEKLEAYLLNN